MTDAPRAERGRGANYLYISELLTLLNYLNYEKSKIKRVIFTG